MLLDSQLVRRRAPVEVVGERPEHRHALGRQVVEVDVGATNRNAEPRASARDDLHDRAGTNTELGADLAVRPPLDVAHRERAPLPSGQDGRAATHQALLLAEERRSLGIVLEIVIGPDRRLDLTVGDLVRVAQLLPEH